MYADNSPRIDITVNCESYKKKVRNCVICGLSLYLRTVGKLTPFIVLSLVLLGLSDRIDNLDKYDA